ncbi:hypothetical protein V2A60_006819 [Cordyceps javanica]
MAPFEHVESGPASLLPLTNDVLYMILDDLEPAHLAPLTQGCRLLQARVRPVLFGTEGRRDRALLWACRRGCLPLLRRFACATSCASGRSRRRSSSASCSRPTPGYSCKRKRHIPPGWGARFRARIYLPATHVPRLRRELGTTTSFCVPRRDSGFCLEQGAPSSTTAGSACPPSDFDTQRLGSMPSMIEMLLGKSGHRLPGK